MKNAAATLAAATALTLTLSLTGAALAADPAHKAEDGHGARKEEPIPPTVGEVGESQFGLIGTGATKRGTAGGGTRTTNHNTIGSGSYGLRPAFAQTTSHESAGPLTGPGFATAPALAVSAAGQAATAPQIPGASLMPAAFQPVPPGALGSAVRDHSFPASPNAPAPGGHFRPNSAPSTQIGVHLPSYPAPAGQSSAGAHPESGKSETSGH